MNQNQNEQTQMSIIRLNADKFEVVGQVTNWEELFLNKENFRQILTDAQEIGRGLVADPTTKEGCTQIKTKAKKISTLKKLIEESKLVLDFDSALLEIEKLKRKCTENENDWLLLAIETLEEIKKEFQQ